jgi:hypothetical protein
MKSSRTPLLALALASLASACDDPASSPAPSNPPGAVDPSTAGKGGAAAKTPTNVAPSLPTVPPLTDESARAILHGQLEDLGGDDVSRQTLLYLADLGDKAGLDAARKLLDAKDGKYEDKVAAAVGIEALLAFGEAGAGAKALDLAKQYVADEEPADEYLVYALARVSAEPERAAAVAVLLSFAAAEGDEADILGDVKMFATAALAKTGAPEAREAFAKIAGDVKLGGQIRGSAVAGLLRLGDARGKTLGEKLVAEATAPVEDPAKAAPAVGDGPPLPDEVIKGLGIEGALDAGALVKKALELVLADESNGGVFEAQEAAKSLPTIYAKGGGQDLAPWLRDLAKRAELIEEETTLALWALGDDSSALAVADQLKGSVSAWASPVNMDPAVDILDVAARRGTARSAAFRVIVDAAAQVGGKSAPQRAGTDYNLRSLNVAAAHAFLKSAPK